LEAEGTPLGFFLPTDSGRENLWFSNKVEPRRDRDRRLLGGDNGAHLMIVLESVTTKPA
jgi:hypothetical protein